MHARSGCFISSTCASSTAPQWHLRFAAVADFPSLRKHTLVLVWASIVLGGFQEQLRILVTFSTIPRALGNYKNKT